MPDRPIFNIILHVGVSGNAVEERVRVVLTLSPDISTLEWNLGITSVRNVLSVE